MLGQSRALRAAAVRRHRRSAFDRRGVGRPDRGHRRSAEADTAFDVGLPLIQLAAAQADTPGHPSVAGAHCSLDSLEIAVGLARSGSAVGVVTGPVSKEQLYAIGFSHPGQTEFVAERCGVAADQRRDDARRTDAAHGPGHHASRARRRPTALTTALIELRGRAALRGLQRNFGIEDPRLAVSGLNPHAGEGGRLAARRSRSSSRRSRRLVAEGWRVTGPHPADTMFHASARAKL